jgi:hypothetical protein
MAFPETSPQYISAAVTLPVSGVASTEVIIGKVKKLGTITDVWAMTDGTAASTSNLTCTIYNRGTALTGTAIIDVLGGAGTTWGATTPKAGTVANNTDIDADSYITAKVERIAASTASAWVISIGAAFVPGSPAAVGAIDT